MQIKKYFLLAMSALLFSSSLPAKSYASSVSYSVNSPDLSKTNLIPKGFLDFTFSVITNDAKPEPVYCYIDGFIAPFEAILISGTKNEGRFRCQGTIPEKPSELRSGGRYPLDVLIVYFDDFGKQELRQTFGYVTFNTPTPVPTISISNINLDKSSVRVGDQLSITFNMASTNLSSNLAQAVALIYLNDSDECEEDCPSAAASLIAGNISNGTWKATFTVPVNKIAGSYTPFVVFNKLKGIPGNFGTGITKLSVTTSTPTNRDIEVQQARLLASFTKTYPITVESARKYSDLVSEYLDFTEQFFNGSKRASVEELKLVMDLVNQMGRLSNELQSLQAQINKLIESPYLKVEYRNSGTVPLMSISEKTRRQCCTNQIVELDVLIRTAKIFFIVGTPTPTPTLSSAIDEFSLVFSDYQKLLRKITALKNSYINNNDLLKLEKKILGLPIIPGKDLSTAIYNIESVNKKIDSSILVWNKIYITKIKCIKGNMIKNITAKNPKCPSGYKRA